jgi:hypothetical protein
MSEASQTLSSVHDFDFLHGRWHIHNRHLLERLTNCDTWETFEATAECRPILGGVGNIDEFVTNHWANFAGMSLRLFNSQTGHWSIYWADTRQVRLLPPVVGSFANGVGIFEGMDELRGQPVRVRYIWSDITITAARWEQAFSPDSGATWETNWIMTLTRA